MSPSLPVLPSSFVHRLLFAAVLPLAGCHFVVSGVSLSDDAASHSDAAASDDLSAVDSFEADLSSEVDADIFDLAAPDLRQLSTGDMLQCLSSCTGCMSACCNDSWSKVGSNNSFACPSSCQCNFTTNDTGNDALSCPSHQSCELTASNSKNVSLSCGVDGECQLHCSGNKGCSMACGTGASCLIDCSGMSAVSCFITNCIPTNCGNGIQVCGRACP